MKNDERHLTDRMELPNQDKIRTPGEKKMYEYLGILEADTIKQLRKSVSGEPKSYSRQNYVA